MEKNKESEMNYQITGIQMNEPWSIPRASLGSITSNLSQNSNPSSIKIHNKKLSHGCSNRGYHSEGSEASSERDRRNRAKQQNHTLMELQNKFDEYSMKQQKQQHSKLRHKKIENIATSINPKRGSRSSQGSTDSNHSTHSASSGSLLLTAANLERFTHIQKKLPDIESCNKIEYDSHQHYKTNIILSSNNNNKRHFDQHNHNQQHLKHADHTAVPIDPNLLHMKTKDVDTMSIASSTHFTMVNGVGGPQRVSSSGICSRGHQITILIVSMSMLFLIGIILAVYLLEMRAREMPH